jgi:hypothetical protein
VKRGRVIDAAKQYLTLRVERSLLTDAEADDQERRLEAVALLIDDLADVLDYVRTQALSGDWGDCTALIDDLNRLLPRDYDSQGGYTDRPWPTSGLVPQEVP